MTWEQAAKAAALRWPREEAIVALAIAAGESGQFTRFDGDPVTAYPQYTALGCNGYLSFGAWQVFMGAHAAKLVRRTGSTQPCDHRTYLLDYDNCADTASEIYNERKGWGLDPWEAWSVYKANLHLQYMNRAAVEIDAATGASHSPTEATTMIQPTLTKWSPNFYNQKPSKKLVIIHTTRSGTANNKTEFEGTVNWLTGGSPEGLSVHKVVDGRVQQRWAMLVRDDCCAVHAGAHNLETWGIETCQGTADEAFPLAQMQLLARVSYDYYVVGQGVPIHHTLNMDEGFIGHEETPQGKSVGKSDPGHMFDWDLFIRLMQEMASPAPAPTQEDDVIKIDAWARADGWFGQDQPREIPGGTVQRLNANYDFNLPAGTKYIEVEFITERGYAVILNGDGSRAGAVGGTPVVKGQWHVPGTAIRVWLDADGWFSINAEDASNPVKMAGAHAVARG